MKRLLILAVLTALVSFPMALGSPASAEDAFIEHPRPKGDRVWSRAKYNDSGNQICVDSFGPNYALTTAWIVSEGRVVRDSVVRVRARRGNGKCIRARFLDAYDAGFLVLKYQKGRSLTLKKRVHINDL